MRHRALLLLAFTAASAWAVDASAAPRTHDGFYLRFGAGFGGVDMQREVEAGIGDAELGLGESSISGGVFHTELSIGGTVGSGVVIGGSLLTHAMGDAEIEDESGTTSELDSPLRFVVLGPSIDWFPDPNGGFHFGGVLGIAAAWARLPEEAIYEGIGGAGGALGLAVGYDWWIGREWSLGALLRLTGASIRGEDEELGITAEERSSVGALTLAFSALYH